MSSLAFNPHLASLPVYVPGRPIEEVARELGLDPSGVIKLASNENPLGPSPKAVEAMQRAVSQVHLYPDGSAFHLKRKLAGILDVPPDQVILGNGSNEILELAGHLMLSPGTEVVVSQYCFAVYPIVTALFGARLVTVPAVRYGHDLDAMRAAITPRTRLMFVANPNNPTGTLASRESVARLLAELPPHVLLVMDEAYIEFLEDPADCLGAIRSGAMPNVLISRTFSKVFGLAGLRVGYGVGSREVISGMEKARQPFNLNSLAQAAASAALDDAAHLAKTRATNKGGLESLHDAFARMGLEFIRSHANFVLVRVGDGQRVFGELQKRGVIVRPMAGYQLPEWIRVSVGTAAENGRFLAALREVLAACRT